MPWTIYRYILREVLKVLLLSTAVLVVVIGFAASIKPLSDGLLSASGMAKFILYSIPTMLGLALPFAAAFAGTLVFCRMAADNEIIACRAGGMSYGAILAPVLGLGLALTLGIFYLSNWVVPRFYVLAQQQVDRDMINLLVRKVEKRESLKQGNMILYADRADDTQPPPTLEGKDQPNRLLILQGVAVGKLSKDGALKREATAERADVLLFRIGDRTKVVMRLLNAMFYDADTGQFAFSRSSEFMPFDLPNPFKDRLSFLSYAELTSLAAQPERFKEVREKKQNLAEAIATEDLQRKIESGLTTGGRHTMTLLAPGDNQKYIISAPRLERTGAGISLGGSRDAPVRVESFASGLPVRRIEAAGGVLSIDADDPDSEPRIKIELERAEVFDARASFRGTQHARLPLPRGRWPEEILAPLAAKTTDDLVELAGTQFKGVAKVEKAANALANARLRLGRRIFAKLHERAASATGCVLVLLLGAVLSMHLRGQMPLVVYFWSFLLASLAIVITHTGESMATDQTHALLVGKAAVWSGDMLLIAATAAIYHRLVKN